MIPLITKGEKAPNFKLEDNNGNMVSLSDFLGKKVLLSWHPLAWTSVCTDQMRALEANKEKFDALGAVALGMSVDPAASKKAWASVLCIRNTLLLSDFWPHGKVAHDYELFLENMGCSGRFNIVIDEKGKVAWAKEYALGELPDLEEVLKAIAQA
ncbi:MAG: redoxin domain-containing protein [Christensenellales bacterium]